jgi:probable phosphoglycerate mutase
MARHRAAAPAELVLWRHGVTGANRAGEMAGQLDLPLIDAGHEQARRAAISLAKLSPRAIVSSDLSRAADTAGHLADLAGPPVELDWRLRETHLGAWQGLTREEAKLRYPDEFAAWFWGHDVVRGGGERARDVAARARAAIDERVRSPEPAGPPLVAVTHAGTARAVIGSLLDLPADRWRRITPLGNCAWSVLGRDHLGWQLLEHNVTSSHGEA